LNPDNLSAVKMQQLAEKVINSVLKFTSSHLYTKMAVAVSGTGIVAKKYLQIKKIGIPLSLTSHSG